MPHVSKNANFSEKGIKNARLATLGKCTKGKKKRRGKERQPSKDRERMQETELPGKDLRK